MDLKIHNHPLVTEARRKAEEADHTAREAAGKIRTLKEAQSSAFRKYTMGHASEEGFRAISQKRTEAEEKAKQLRIEADRLKEAIRDAESQAAEEMGREIGERIRELTPAYLEALEEARPHLERLIEAGRELGEIYTRLENERTISLRRHGVAVDPPFPNPTLTAALPVSAAQFTKALEKCLKTEKIHA